MCTGIVERTISTTKKNDRVRGFRGWWEHKHLTIFVRPCILIFSLNRQ